jgi:uncharacterized protein
MSGGPGESGNGQRAQGTLPRQVKCPHCGRLAAYAGNPWRPFCSERCKLTDLGQWAEGRYAIPAEKLPDEDEG